MSALDIEVTVGSVRALPVPAGTAALTVVSAGCWYYGCTFQESTGAATATVTITSGGNFVDAFQLAQSDVQSHWFGPMGIRVDAGITVTVTSGSADGAVFAGYEKP